MTPVVSAAVESIGLDAIPFHIHWDVLGVAAVLVIGYVYGLTKVARRHAPQGEPAVSRWQIVSFAAAIALLVAVRTWPIHDIGEASLFTFHTIEHIVISMVVPPLLLLGVPWWLMRQVVRPVLPLLRVLTRPILALLMFNAVLAFIHWTRIVELMLSSEPAHLGLHALLFVTALIMWWPVIGPVPDLPRLSPFMSMGYLFLQSLVPTIPASFLTFASAPLYHVYEELPRLWGLDALTDQLIAGLIMKVGAGLILWTAITIIWFRWAAEEDRGRELARRSRVVS